MSNTICSSNITSGFIDLATYDELEKYMYGCGDAVAYFVRTTCKSTWFTQVPVILSNASGQAEFGRTWSVSISRAGDYLLQTWLRVGLPEVRALNGGNDARFHIRWTRNFMHNLIQDCCITFNDLVAARFDNHHLDFWAAFTVPASKQVAYDNMIGNTAALTGGSNNYLPARLNNSSQAAPQELQSSLQSDRTWLNLPLPFFYSRDSGVALPTAALPYNEMRINFQFRNWWELLVVEDTQVAAGFNQPYRVNTDPTAGTQIATSPGVPSLLGYVQVWANYAIVSNDERKRMACAPRDILIEQAQMANTQTVTPNSVQAPSIDLRLSHAIKVLFFAVKNVTHSSEHSTYTVGSPSMGLLENNLDKFSGQYQLDPIDRVSLVYENTNRLGQMGADYFTMVNPYFHAPSVPDVNGYHSYSYSLDFICLDPMGSTNYGKLTNVSIMPEFTGLAQGANGANTGAANATALPLGFNVQPAPGNPNGSGVQRQQSYLFVLTCVNNNIIRISGGALGFPVL
jgi:hypothetical protein